MYSSVGEGRFSYCSRARKRHLLVQGRGDFTARNRCTSLTTLGQKAIFYLCSEERNLVLLQERDDSFTSTKQAEIFYFCRTGRDHSLLQFRGNLLLLQDRENSLTFLLDRKKFRTFVGEGEIHLVLQNTGKTFNPAEQGRNSFSLPEYGRTSYTQFCTVYGL